jgi:hypothetical protein
MLNTVNPAMAKLVPTFGQALAPLSYILARSRPQRTRRANIYFPMLRKRVAVETRESFVANDCPSPGA